MLGARSQRWERCCCLTLASVYMLLCILMTTSLAFEPILITGKLKSGVDYVIRDSTPEDLSYVSDLTTNSFYFHPSSATRHHARMEEYGRLLSQHPSSKADKSMHRMLVCTVATQPHVVLGFCQLHNRPPHPNPFFTHNPRPLITDLAVCPSMRRNGLAKKMIDICEWISTYEYGSPSVSLRVINTNEPARLLYENLGYHYVNCYEVRYPELLMLQKELTPLQKTLTFAT